MKRDADLQRRSRFCGLRVSRCGKQKDKPKNTVFNTETRATHRAGAEGARKKTQARNTRRLDVESVRYFTSVFSRDAGRSVAAASSTRRREAHLRSPPRNA